MTTRPSFLTLVASLRQTAAAGAMGQRWRRPQAKSWWHLCALQYCQTPHCLLPHTFSAFWLRSSVVSVLISLISNTESTALHDIKLIFGRGPVTCCACTTARTPVAPVLHCLGSGRPTSYHDNTWTRGLVRIHCGFPKTSPVSPTPTFSRWVLRSPTPTGGCRE